MDPSSYNNPQYYPPTPPQQGYPTQQQGYPPAKPHRHQNSYSGSNTNDNLNELDQGCFKIYKVALFIAFLWRIYTLGDLVRLIVTFGIGSFDFTIVIVFIQEIASMALILIQFLAMKDRNLHKAKIALIGFLGYYFTCFVYQTFISLQFFEDDDLKWIASGYIFIFIDIALTVIGSFKVYQFLNVNKIKSEADNYSYYQA